jgi:RND family efflux transporter MFP subunit
MKSEPTNPGEPAGRPGTPSVPPPANPSAAAGGGFHATPQPAGAARQSRSGIGGRLEKLDRRVLGILLAVVIALMIWWAVAYHGKRGVEASTESRVAVARVTRADLYNEVTIPAEFRPYVEVELHAKVSGYVDQMNVDFGDKVKAGQLLATLLVPELYAQLTNAMALQDKAEADYTNAHQIYVRLKTVDAEHPNLVAQQELDTAQSRDSSAEAAIAAARADVGRYQTLVDYTRITAPFDGVITRRYVDPGALVQAGTASETQSLPVVRVSDNYRLRLDFPVSVAYVKDMHVGDSVEVRVESLSGMSFTGAITRATLKVTEETRTMVTEIEVPNPNLEIVPGMYSTVVLKLQKRPNTLVIPAEAVATDQKSTVFVVNDRQEIEERPVTLGLETPNQYEVISGLKEGELVMIGNRSRVRPGQKVESKMIGSGAAEPVVRE